MVLRKDHFALLVWARPFMLSEEQAMGDGIAVLQHAGKMGFALLDM